MFNKKNLDAQWGKTLTIIAEGVEVEGKVHSHGSIRIDGKIIGEIIAEKDFVIGKEGVVQAGVKTTNAVVSGNFNGEMIASGEVEITSTGRFVGKLYQKDALLTISKGGIFKGENVITDDQEIFNISIPENKYLQDNRSQATLQLDSVINLESR